MKSKLCRNCQQLKDVSQFYLKKASKDGYQTDCKECQNASRKERERKGGTGYLAKVERRFKRRGLIQSGTQGDIRHLIEMRDTISEITGTEHHLGHIHPVTHTLICGLHTPKNIVIEPAYVNLSHSNQFVPYRVIFNGSSVRYMELSGYTWLPQDKPSWHPIISVNNLI